MLPQISHENHDNHYLFDFANSSKESLHVQRQKKEQREQNLQKAQEESRYVSGSCSEKHLGGKFNDFVQKYVDKSRVYYIIDMPCLYFTFIYRFFALWL